MPKHLYASTSAYQFLVNKKSTGTPQAILTIFDNQPIECQLDSSPSFREGFHLVEFFEEDCGQSDAYSEIATALGSASIDIEDIKMSFHAHLYIPSMDDANTYGSIRSVNTELFDSEHHDYVFSLAVLED